MLMSRITAALVALALVFAILGGRTAALAASVTEGAASALSLMIAIGGTVCLWSGLMEVMVRSGLSGKAARLLGPVIRLLFGRDGRDPEAGEAIARNMAANLLGLGSAATPAGLQAAKRLQTLAQREGKAPDKVFLLMVLNTASLQLVPTTVAAVRAGLGSAQPYDILPAVWLASALSIGAGILACGLLRKVWPR